MHVKHQYQTLRRAEYPYAFVWRDGRREKRTQDPESTDVCNVRNTAIEQLKVLHRLTLQPQGLAHFKLRCPDVYLAASLSM